ncbi:MAG: hypothetical protein DLM58_04175 [Pseudonocardiales bacterium]|nr:MAG: hypothetical protein DLM58_04175 [Pseudonocardiales bacterium]
MPNSGPPLDPEGMAALALNPPMAPTLAIEDIPRLRRSGDGKRHDLTEILAGTDIDHAEYSIPAFDGASIIATVLRPPGLGFRCPGIYYLHGGGMVSGSRFSEADLFPDWITRFGVAVVTLEYRLAPEHPHPIPVEDCYAGLVWTAARAEELGIDANRILVGGHSAGGGLAAAVALMARDRGGPALIGQLLMCPMLDDRDDTVSNQQFRDARGFWNGNYNLVGWTALLGERRGAGTVSPYAAPARAQDLGGLPPAYIDVGSSEVFRDEDVAYAGALWAAGGQAELHVWAGGFHGFDRFGHLGLSQAATEARQNWLRRLIGTSIDGGHA